MNLLQLVIFGDPEELFYLVQVFGAKLWRTVVAGAEMKTSAICYVY